LQGRYPEMRPLVWADLCVPLSSALTWRETAVCLRSPLARVLWLSLYTRDSFCINY
jgi:hypothetical protein